MIPKGRRIHTAFFSKQYPFSLIHGRLLSLRVYQIPGQIQANFAVVVSKKTAKDAVTRNKLRRRVYTAIRDSLADVPKELSMVLYPKKEILTADYTEVKMDVAFCVKESLRVLKRATF